MNKKTLKKIGIGVLILGGIVLGIILGLGIAVDSIFSNL